MSKNRAEKRQPWEVDFIQVELSKEQKDALKKWDVKLETTIDSLDRLIVDGFKLSVSFDRVHDCAIASLTSPKNDNGDRQQCLVARGPNYLGALRAIAFKHHVVLEGEWSGIANKYDPDSQWG